MKKLRLWLFDSEYRALGKRRKALIKQDEVFSATLARTRELAKRPSNKTHVTASHLQKLQSQVRSGIKHNLQLLHETDIEIKKKLGIDVCDNG